MDHDKLHVVSFSGGKDSTAMLLMMLERGMPVDEIVFCDTGKEFPAMYDHIAEVERYIGREITRIKAKKGFDYWLGDHIKTKGKNKGKRGYGWPDFRNRWCTGFLKRDEFNRYLRGKTVIEYHGIAIDERERTENNRGTGRVIRYPLVDWSITEEQALQYCYDKGFDWDGLYKRFNRVSCYCCPLQHIGELRTLYTYYSALWDDMLTMDKRSYRKFRPDYSLDELTSRFAKETGIVYNVSCQAPEGAVRMAKTVQLREPGSAGGGYPGSAGNVSARKWKGGEVAGILQCASGETPGFFMFNPDDPTDLRLLDPCPF